LRIVFDGGKFLVEKSSGESINKYHEPLISNSNGIQKFMDKEGALIFCYLLCFGGYTISEPFFFTLFYILLYLSL